MVGHTHEDIDGLFGVLSGRMAHSHAFTRREMEELFNESQQTASKPQQHGGAARDGLGIDNFFFPSDKFDTRFTDSIPNYRELFEV